MRGKGSGGRRMSKQKKCGLDKGKDSGGGRMPKQKKCGLDKGNITNKVGANVNGASSATVVNGVGDIFKTPAIINLSRPGVENLLKLENQSEPWLIVLCAPWCQFCQGMEASYIELAEKISGSSVKVAKFRADGDYKDFASCFGSFPTISGSGVKVAKFRADVGYKDFAKQQELQFGSFPTILSFQSVHQGPSSIPLSNGMLIRR